MGRDQDAERAMRLALEIGPAQFAAHPLISFALLQQGKPE
jgi:hypothetical protein